MPASPLMPLEEALQILLQAAVAPDSHSRIALDRASGRVLASDYLAVLDVPPADNSAMDGYAVRAADAGRLLPVSQRIAAGEVGQSLAEGSIARIFTGASIPLEADAVVMQEDVTQVGDAHAGGQEQSVRLPSHISVGQHVRRRGQDCARGDLLLSQGRRLRPQDLGLLASQGVAEIEVFAPLRVALLATGSELREPGEGTLPPGAIYNSNRPMLAALLEALGCEVVDLGIVEDSAQATRSALREAAQAADLIISCGGVSVGEADFVRDAVSALGAIQLWRIAIKPGKPFAFGQVDGVPFVGLPGNPSSAFVTFMLLARPYLCALQGRSDPVATRIPARADFTQPAGGREEFLRASIKVASDGLWATPYSNQSSGVLRSVSASDALAIVPSGTAIERGDSVELLLLDSLLV